MFVCLLVVAGDVVPKKTYHHFWMCFESSLYANSSVPHNLAVGRKMKTKKASFE